jgi:ABC-type branched-subunit amino acid transport system substrate-binding protein
MTNFFDPMKRGGRVIRSFLFALCALHAVAGTADEAPLQIAAALSLTGDGAYYGKPILDGIRLAIDEANQSAGTAAHISVESFDDRSDPAYAHTVADKVCATQAIAVIGPALTVAALAAGPVYAQCGLVAIAATAHGDDVPKAATTFQPVFNGSSMGTALAVYLKQVLHADRVIILYRQDGYGTPVARGVESAAAKLSVATTEYAFTSAAERDAAVQAAARDPGHPTIVLGMLNADAVPILLALRRAGSFSPVLAPSSLGGDDFVEQFSGEPEVQQNRGFFTDNVYAASPMLFDSANSDVLEFAQRFRERYGHEPSWPAVQGYDSAQLAILAARRAGGDSSTTGGLAERRATAFKTLSALDSAHTLPGVTGPLWFTADRRRDQPVRLGLFRDGRFDSAPIQLVPVDNPAPEEIASGEVFEALPGKFVRRQRVVYTGVFVNEVPRVDLQKSTFIIDFYLWMRFVENAGPIGFEPSDIRFAGLSGASFNRANPSEQRLMADGTTYRLWHVEGEVRNEFDLRRFPFDSQILRLSFYNSRADADRVVYVLDRGSLPSGGRQTLRPAADDARAVAASASVVSSTAFRLLTQWMPVWASERRENLVTDSPLGYPYAPGTARGRELSGFVVDLDLQRRALATASKNLLPLIIMTIIMFASLYFPHGLVKEKVTVAITAALSGAVLLTSINTQLGNLGYTIMAEYVFYVFFGLSLLCILSVLSAERLRVAGAPARALTIERLTRAGFVFTVAAVLVGAGWVVRSLAP